MQSQGACIRDGDLIALYHPSCKGHAAGGSINVAGVENITYPVTLLKEETEETPRKRFTFVSTEKNHNILCWGVPFQIVHYTDNKKLHVASALKTQHQVTTFSCEQQVYLTEKDDYTTHWKALMPARSKTSGQIRYLFEGSPILSNEPMIIVHCMTNNMLCSETKYQIFNASSAMRELEVFCCSRYEPGLVHNLRDEFSGLKTAQTICRKNADVHEWFMVPKAEQSLCSMMPDPQVKVTALFNDLVQKLRKRGLLSLSLLRLKLIQESSSLVPLCKVFEILADMDISLDEDEVHLISSLKDGEVDSVEQINIFKMISTIRGTNVFKVDEMVRKVFRSIAQDGKFDKNVFKETIVRIDSERSAKSDDFIVTIGTITENGRLILITL
jgi:hypothetical protein